MNDNSQTKAQELRERLNGTRSAIGKMKSLTSGLSPEKISQMSPRTQTELTLEFRDITADLFWNSRHRP